jgi:hypothetical protein
MKALSLLAAPTFAVMALVTAIGGSPLDAFCGASPLGGMTTMYLLMSLFHAAPWLRLITSCSSSSPPIGGEVR